MRTSFHGNDDGGALMISVVAIFIFSALFVSFVPIVKAKIALAEHTLSTVLEANERANHSVRRDHDLF